MTVRAATSLTAEVGSCHSHRRALATATSSARRGSRGVEERREVVRGWLQRRRLQESRRREERRGWSSRRQEVAKVRGIEGEGE